MVTDRLLATIITIYKGSVGLPRSRTLVLQLFPVRIMISDSFLYLLVHSFLYQITHLAHLRQDRSNVIYTTSIVKVFRPLSLALGQVIHIKTGGMRRLDNIVKKLEGCAFVSGDFRKEFVEERSCKLRWQEIVYDRAWSMCSDVSGIIQV